MKKKFAPPIKPQIEDEDPIDGAKAAGCLFAGIILLAIFFSVGAYLISLIH